MPYTLLTNVADFDALLGEIRNFLNATGDWTIHQDLIAPDEGVASGGRQLVISNGGVLAGLRSTDTGVGADRLFLFDGVPPYGSPPSLDQLPDNSGVRYQDSTINSAGEPANRHLQQWAGPFPTAHLFTDDPSTYCHVVVERAAGVFVHLAFGHLLKFGTWTGGAYYSTHMWAQDSTNIDQPASQAHSVLFDNIANGAKSWTVHYEESGAKWITGGNADSTLNSVSRKAGTATVRGGFGRMFKNIAESLFSGFIPLGPIVVGAVTTADTPDTVRFIGQVPDIRVVNITNLSPGESLTIGADEYLCFPLQAKNGATDQYNSGVSGLAYLKRP